MSEPLDQALDAINARVNRGLGEGLLAAARWRDALIEVGGMLDDLINALDATRAAERTLDVAWREAEAALPDGWRLRRGRWDVHSLGGWHFDASVDAFADALGGGDANGVSCDVGHADPSQALIEALDALTAALIEKRSGAES